jgi:hypothetical protein
LVAEAVVVLGGKWDVERDALKVKMYTDGTLAKGIFPTGFKRKKKKKKLFVECCFCVLSEVYAWRPGDMVAHAIVRKERKKKCISIKNRAQGSQGWWYK